MRHRGSHRNSSHTGATIPGMPIPLLIDGPPEAPATLILAHGAGAAMDSAWMNRVASGIAATGIRVVRFEFPYMHARREGRRPGPDRPPVLMQSWRDVVAQFAPASTVIGGKSMGGRIASMVADELSVAGLVCLGYPFHPPGRPDRLRTEHLRDLRTPTVIFQGTRDPFGVEAEVATYALSPAIRIRWMPDGDHDLKPRKESGFTHARHLDAVIAEAAQFVREVVGKPQPLPRT